MACATSMATYEQQAKRPTFWWDALVFKIARDDC